MTCYMSHSLALAMGHGHSLSRIAGHCGRPRETTEHSDPPRRARARGPNGFSDSGARVRVNADMESKAFVPGALRALRAHAAHACMFFLARRPALANNLLLRNARRSLGGRPTRN